MAKGSGAKKRERRRIAASRLLSAVPHKNTTIQVKPAEKGVLVSIPVRRPNWLVPPISWILPWSAYRRVQLDEAGTEVLNLCDGNRTIEEIIERFSQAHKLSFRESQVAVTQFLRDLLQRGIIALVGT